MGRNSIIWPMLEYQQQQRQLQAEGTAGQVLMNYPWQQGGGQQPQPPMPGQSSQPQQDQQPQAQPTAYTPSRGVSGPPDWNQKGGMSQMAGGGAWPSKDYAIQKAQAYAKEKGASPEQIDYVGKLVGQEYGGPANPIGDKGSSFGGLQLHYGGMVPGVATLNNKGLGDEFTAATGKSAKDPRNFDAALRFGVDKLMSGGSGPWATSAGKIGQYPGAGGGATPASANMTRLLAPSAPAMSLEGIVQTAKRINPSISGQELFATVSALSPLMSKETQDQFRMVQLQMREMQLEQSQQRINDSEIFNEERMQLNQEKQQEKEQIDEQKLELQRARLGLAAQKWDEQKKEFNQKFDQAEEKIQNAKTMQEKSFALRQAYEAKNQALRAKGEAIQAASNIADPDLRKQFMDQANADYEEAEQRYKKLSDTYKSERDNVPSASGGTVESRKTEAVGEPKSTDKQTTINQAKQAIAAGKDPEKVKAKLKELGIDPSALDSNDRVPSGVEYGLGN